MKANVLESSLGKSAKDLLKAKDKLKQYHLHAKQYNSLCDDVEIDPLQSSIVPQLRHRQHSKKDVRDEQVTKLVRSKSRQIQKNSERKPQPPKKHDIGALYSELMAVKSEYKKLKGSYEVLAKEKTQFTNRSMVEQTELKLSASQKASKQIEKYHKNVQILQFELQRIRKECLRVVQTEKFKNKRLEEIIQQKDLTIAYLRGQVQRQKKWHQTAITTTNQTSMSYCHTEPHHLVSSVNCSQISNIVVDEHKNKQEDSLCFSCDPSKEMESMNSVFANQRNPKKDKFIVEPKTNDPFTQPSQCLTFQQRDQDLAEMKNEVKQMKMPPRQTKKDVSKSKVNSRKMKLATQCDENLNKNNRLEQLGEKQLTLTAGFTKQRKKASSSRKKN